MRPDDIQFLLEQKLTFVNTVANVSMLWWVSSVTFCVSILGAIWVKRHELSGKGFIMFLGPLLTFFFGSIVFYGCLICWYLWRTMQEIPPLANALQAQKLGIPGVNAYFHTELLIFLVAMANGATSFFVVLCVWLYLWRKLSQGEWARLLRSVTGPTSDF